MLPVAGRANAKERNRSRTPRCEESQVERGVEEQNGDQPKYNR
jgi:hypothetical protein